MEYVMIAFEVFFENDREIKPHEATIFFNKMCKHANDYNSEFEWKGESPLPYFLSISTKTTEASSVLKHGEPDEANVFLSEFNSYLSKMAKAEADNLRLKIVRECFWLTFLKSKEDGFLSVPHIHSYNG